MLPQRIIRTLLLALALAFAGACPAADDGRSASGQDSFQQAIAIASPPALGYRELGVVMLSLGAGFLAACWVKGQHASGEL